VKLPLEELPSESVTVTANVAIVTPVGGVPVSTPPELSPNQLGNDSADQV
jgi:hypothetical protein